jgi:Flp pilus assembly protein TadD
MTPAASAILQVAFRHFNAGELGHAQTVCRELLAKYPDEPDLLHLLALVCKKSGDFPEAERLLRRCLEIAPRRVDVRANLGNLYAAAGEPDQAEAAYRLALQNDATFRPARLGLARTLLRAGRHESALLEARHLTDENETDGEGWTVAGTALRELGRDDLAEAALCRALAIAPGSGVARHNLGALRNNQGRSEEALAELQRAQSAGIRGPEISFNLAAALMGLNRFDEAEATLISALTATPRNLHVHRLLARLRYMRGSDNFAAQLSVAVQQFPDDLALRITYSQILRGAGLPDAAAETLSAVAETSDPRLEAEMAAMHQETGEFEAAYDAAWTACKADPDNPKFSDLLIDALMSLGRADEALPHIEAARRRQPLNQWYIAMEATAARLLGDSRYPWLYDYEGLVHVFELEPPSGWSGTESFHADLASVLKARHRFRAAPLDQSLRHGTQTPRGLLGDPDPVIRAFIAALSEPLAEYRSRIGFDAEHPFRSRNRGDIRLSGCWSVRLGTGGFHVNHVHPEGWISSACYIEVPAECGDTDRRAGWIKFGETRFAVPGAAAERFIQPKPGRLVLFPSYMWHGTTPTSGSDARMSVAFDAVPVAVPDAVAK